MKPGNLEKSTDTWDMEGSGLERFRHLQYPNSEWSEESRRSSFLISGHQRIVLIGPEILIQAKKTELSKVSKKMLPGS